jgi:hypothetical protein
MGDLAHLSPLGWEHINLTGDYHWDTSPTLGPDEFRRSAPMQMTSPQPLACFKVRIVSSPLSARRKSSIARKNCYRCQSPVVPEPEPVIDETSLAQHRATLVRDQDGWLLRYPLQGRSFYDERAFQPPDRNHGSTWRGFAPDGGAFAARPQPAQEIPAEPAEVQQTPPPSLPCNAALILRLPEGGGEIVALRIRGKGNFLLTKSQ